MSRRWMALVGLAVCAAACARHAEVAEAPADPLKGAWRLVAMQIVAPDGKTIDVAVQESLFIFADGYYSMGYVFGNERPAAYAERWHPTDGEKIARFSSMLASAGTYRITGSEIVARPLFALAPEFVRGEGRFSFRFAGDTLELTWDKSIAFDGLEYPSAGRVTVLRLARAQ